MSELFCKKCKSLVRAFLFVNVLAALLFSCGEGIRLLPFPQMELARNARFKIKDNHKIPYQYNIHRFENGQGIFQTKSPRDDAPHQLANAGDLQNDLKPFFPATLRRFERPRRSLFFKARPFLSLRGSRAPPVA